MKHISINQQKCDMCGICIELCPAVFEVKNGKIVILEHDAPHDWSKCFACVPNCPQQAIEFVSDKTNKVKHTKHSTKK